MALRLALPTEPLSYSYILSIFIVTSLIYLTLIKSAPRSIRMATTISDKVLALCTKTGSVSQALQNDPTKAPSQAAKELFKNHKNALSDDQSSQSSKSSEESDVFPRKVATDDSLLRAKQCGNFGNCEPSELFLRLFHDGLLALEHDPLIGVVSPSLMGSTGTMPLTVIGVVWDMARHMVRRRLEFEARLTLQGEPHSSSRERGLLRDKLLDALRRFKIHHRGHEGAESQGWRTEAEDSLQVDV
jgi:hypothetical protein